MLSSVARSLPRPVVDGVIRAKVTLDERLGRNRFTYDCGRRTIEVRYSDATGFRQFHDLVVDGKLRNERVPLTYLDLPPSVDLIVDVGAHFGTYAVVLGLLNPDATLRCFEPDEYNRTVLRTRLEDNGVRAEVRPEVVTDHTGEVSFYRDARTGSQGHSTTPGDGRRVEVTKRCVALSEVLAATGAHSAFLKIDAEGEEYNVARDLVGTDAVSDLRCLVEMHPDKLDGTSPEAVVRVLEEGGFRSEFVSETAPGYEHAREMYYFERLAG